jgi:hypothetical protein
MADELDSMLLVYLRRIDEKVDRVLEVLSEHGRRITSLAAQVANLHGDFAGQSLRMDRIDRRLDRIEKRLELTPAS